jgi:hypothetical protein
MIAVISVVDDDSSHDGPYEADTQDDNNLMTLGAVIGGKGLEALEFSDFILLRGEGELFAVGSSRGCFGHGRFLVCGAMPVNRHSQIYDII